MDRIHRSVIVLVFLALCCGCNGRALVELHPVSGLIRYKGKPAAKAFVVFHDVRPAQELRQTPIPRATTDTEGRFTLSSYTPDSNDGAPVGKYVVTVTLPAESAPTKVEDPPRLDPEMVEEGPDQLRGKYADPSTSPLSVEVNAGENTLPPFDLT